MHLAGFLNRISQIYLPCSGSRRKKHRFRRLQGAYSTVPADRSNDSLNDCSDNEIVSGPRWLCYSGPMDPIALVFYAAVCGILSLLSPQIGGGRLVRPGAGASVGIVAAAPLPVLRDAVGY